MSLKLKKRVKKMWLEALRSGDYKKGVHGLRQSASGEEQFCCLGVLCDLAVKDGLDIAVENDGRWFRYGGNTGTPPTAVYEWAFTKESLKAAPFGPDLGALTIPNDREGRSIAFINDYRADSFDPIADIIEQEF